MGNTGKGGETRNEQRKVLDSGERRLRALEQIATALGQIHHELIQLRVQAANINVSLARKR
jgi:hypothetical protein